MTPQTRVEVVSWDQGCFPRRGSSVRGRPGDRGDDAPWLGQSGAEVTVTAKSVRAGGWSVLGDASERAVAAGAEGLGAGVGPVPDIDQLGRDQIQTVEQRADLIAIAQGQRTPRNTSAPWCSIIATRSPR